MSKKGESCIFCIQLCAKCRGVLPIALTLLGFAACSTDSPSNPPGTEQSSSEGKSSSSVFEQEYSSSEGKSSSSQEVIALSSSSQDWQQSSSSSVGVSSSSVGQEADVTNLKKFANSIMTYVKPDDLYNDRIDATGALFSETGSIPDNGETLYSELPSGKIDEYAVIDPKVSLYAGLCREGSFGILTLDGDKLIKIKMAPEDCARYKEELGL